MGEVGGEDEEGAAVVELREPLREGALERRRRCPRRGPGTRQNRPSAACRNGSSISTACSRSATPGHHAGVAPLQGGERAVAERDVAQRRAVGRGVVEGVAAEGALVGRGDDDDPLEVAGLQEAEGARPRRGRSSSSRRAARRGRPASRAAAGAAAAEAHQEVRAGDEVRPVLRVPGAGERGRPRARRARGLGAEGDGGGGAGRDERRRQPPRAHQPCLHDGLPRVNAALRVARLAGARDADRGRGRDRALRLAQPAADAAVGVEPGPLHAHDACRRARTASAGSSQMAFGLVGQTSSQTTHGVAIAQGRQRPQSKKAVPILTRVPLARAARPALRLRRERRDRAGGADLAAARAARLAPAAARDEDRRVEPLEARRRERGLERRGRARVHAGPAADAAGEERVLGQGARRADRLRRGLGRGGAQQGQQRRAGEGGAHELAPRQVDAAVRRRGRGEGAERDRVLRADRDAVEADVALGDAVLRERLVRALAVAHAAVAVVAERRGPRGCGRPRRGRRGRGGRRAGRGRGTTSARSSGSRRGGRGRSRR